jgi:hypothetical protein
MKRKASSFALSVFFLCSLLFLPPVSSVNPGYGDYSIQTAALSDPPSALNFSSQGFFITGGSGCDDGGSWSGGGSKYICDYETKSQLYSYSWYTRITPLLYNDTILLINGEQGRPDFGEQNQIFGLNTETWAIEFTINAPWNDGWVADSVVISPDKEYLAISRGNCLQIWNMQTMSNDKLFADYQGSSSSYCSGLRTLVSVFSPDSSIYVGYEPGAGNTIAAYSTESWSKLGVVQSLSDNDETAKEFIFTKNGNFAYYIENGGWDDDNKRLINKIFKINLTNQANLWDESTHTEFFFGPTELDSSTSLMPAFSNHQPVGYIGENRVEISSLRSVDEFNAFLIQISGDTSSRAYPHNGVVLFSSDGIILGEMIGGSIGSVEIEYLDSDGDGTPDYMDGAPWDPRDIVDSDGDGVGDSNDAFPLNPNQTDDRDGDGYGDRQYKEDSDVFPDDPTQWFDSDGDGYGDNLEGNNPDLFPEDRDQWNDSDGDGYGDNRWGDRIDFFPDDPTRWADSDRDGVADEDDYCPDVIGFLDIDGDGYCEVEDDDDDGDGFEDLMEDQCGTNSTNASSYPSDIDSDYVCDDVDTDIDGDNVSNAEDLFPFDGTEWNDLDSDGVGNNSDACVGTYGTSTVDRLGCLDQDGDGVSDLNDLDPYDAEIGLDEYDGPRLDIVEENETNQSTNQIDIASESDGVVVSSTIGVLCIAGIIIFVRSRTSSPDDEEEEFGEADEFYRNVTATPVASSDEPSTQSTPDFSLSGSQHESGYEVLEYPEDSEKWWWKDEENQCWVPWE